MRTAPRETREASPRAVFSPRCRPGVTHASTPGARLQLDARNGLPRLNAQQPASPRGRLGGVGPEGGHLDEVFAGADVLELEGAVGTGRRDHLVESIPVPG